jgi:hypothetical protein
MGNTTSALKSPVEGTCRMQPSDGGAYPSFLRSVVSTGVHHVHHWRNFSKSKSQEGDNSNARTAPGITGAEAE